MDDRITKQPARPPVSLFHGTARALEQTILEQGLLPMNRQYVHLSSDQETALIVGRRKDKQPILFCIRAEEAWQDGIAFYQETGGIWLADRIPGVYITVVADER